MSSYVRWIQKAEEDLKVAEQFLGETPAWIVAFHAQQAIEKYLKSFLVKNNKKIIKSHDLLELLDLCLEIDDEFRELENIPLEQITMFATITRYPEMEVDVTDKEAKEAIEIAEKVRDFVLNKLERDTGEGKMR